MLPETLLLKYEEQKMITNWWMLYRTAILNRTRISVCLHPTVPCVVYLCFISVCYASSPSLLSLHTLTLLTVYYAISYQFPLCLSCNKYNFDNFINYWITVLLIEVIFQNRFRFYNNNNRYAKAISDTICAVWHLAHSRSRLQYLIQRFMFSKWNFINPSNCDQLFRKQIRVLDT